MVIVLSRFTLLCIRQIKQFWRYYEEGDCPGFGGNSITVELEFHLLFPSLQGFGIFSELARICGRSETERDGAFCCPEGHRCRGRHGPIPRAVPPVSCWRHCCSGEADEHFLLIEQGFCLGLYTCGWYSFAIFIPHCYMCLKVRKWGRSRLIIVVWIDVMQVVNCSALLHILW